MSLSKWKPTTPAKERFKRVHYWLEHTNDMYKLGVIDKDTRYNIVTRIIRFTGSLTLKYGHCEDSDLVKTRAYNLIEGK